MVLWWLWTLCKLPFLTLYSLASSEGLKLISEKYSCLENLYKKTTLNVGLLAVLSLGEKGEAEQNWIPWYGPIQVYSLYIVNFAQKFRIVHANSNTNFQLWNPICNIQEFLEDYATLRLNQVLPWMMYAKNKQR